MLSRSCKGTAKFHKIGKFRQREGLRVFLASSRCLVSACMNALCGRWVVVCLLRRCFIFWVRGGVVLCGCLVLVVLSRRMAGSVWDLSIYAFFRIFRVSSCAGSSGQVLWNGIATPSSTGTARVTLPLNGPFGPMATMAKAWYWLQCPPDP